MEWLQIYRLITILSTLRRTDEIHSFSVVVQWITKLQICEISIELLKNDVVNFDNEKFYFQEHLKLNLHDITFAFIQKQNDSQNPSRRNETKTRLRMTQNIKQWWLMEKFSCSRLGFWEGEEIMNYYACIIPRTESSSKDVTSPRND